MVTLLVEAGPRCHVASRRVTHPMVGILQLCVEGDPGSEFWSVLWECLQELGRCLGVCTSVIGCHWLWWLGDMPLSPLVVSAVCHCTAFQPFLGLKWVSGTETEKEEEHCPKPNCAKRKELHIMGGGREQGERMEWKGWHSEQGGKWFHLTVHWGGPAKGQGLTVWLHSWSKTAYLCKVARARGTG